VVPPCVVVAIVVVWLPLEIAVLPEIVVGPLETAVVIAFGASNPGHPKYSASPNVCSFLSCASSVKLAGGVFVGNPIDALSNDAPYSHCSNLMINFNEYLELFFSRSAAVSAAPLDSAEPAVAK